MSWTAYGTRRPFVSAMPLLIFGVACEASLKDIEKWKQTQRGPDKIRAVLLNEGTASRTRIAAALAMIDIGELTHLDEALKELGDRASTIAEPAIDELVPTMRGSNPKAPPKAAQVKAKDGLFTMRAYASDAARGRVDRELVEWLAVDLNERMQLGSHSAEKIVTAIGRPAGPALAKSLGPKTLDLVEPAALLRKVGDEAAVKLGADNLIRLASVQKPTRESTYLALGKLGGPRAAGYLNGIAREAELQKRIWAFRALILVGDASSVPVAKAVAADNSLTDDYAVLRDLAFQTLGIIAKNGDDAGKKTLLGFLSSGEDIVRWTAVDSLCATRNEQLVADMIAGLPTDATYTPEDFRDYLESRVRQEVGARIVPALRKMLASRSWVARLAAVRILGDLGSNVDLATLESLAKKDKTSLKGWPAGSTIGSEAKAAAKKIRERG